MRRLGWAAAGVVALAPLLIRAQDLRTGAATALCLLLAAIGLNLAVGYAGEPSLGQGAFMGVGGYAFALIRTRSGWDPITAFVAAIIVTSAAGWVVARGVARLRPAYVALTTWLIAWSFSLALASFPGVSGGSGGIVLGATRLRLQALGVSVTLGPVAVFEIALAACVLGFVIAALFVRRWGPALSATREDPGVAMSEGVDVPTLRRRTLIICSAYAGAAGALLVIVAGVADPIRYAPLLSVKLFIVVVLGGAASMAGPAAGLIGLLAVSQFTRFIVSASGSESGRVEPLVAGAALVIVLIAGGRGIVPEIASLRRKRIAREPEPATRGTYEGAALEIRELTVDFEGLRALDGARIDVRSGSIHAVIGPNGSGKTTLLRTVSGAIEPLSGDVVLDGAILAPGQRVAAGIARTFQRTIIVPGSGTRDHALAGMETRREQSLHKVLLRTPSSRRDEAFALAEASVALARLGLHAQTLDPAEQLTAQQQRLLQIARALASRPRVLLLDEPSAGMDREGEDLLRHVLQGLRSDGLTIVVVEHNLRLVAAIADRVTVLDAGRVIAEGTPTQIARDDIVRKAYLG